MVWNEADQGMTWKEVPIPEDLKETVKEWRDKLIEAVAESDDKLMEKYFADPEQPDRSGGHERGAQEHHQHEHHAPPVR
jgi:elongation factor G